MDNVDFFKEVLLALKFELIRYRIAAAVLAVIILFVVLFMGLTWKDQYLSASTVAVEINEKFEPLLRNNANNKKVDHLAEANDLITSAPLVEEAARQLGYIDANTSPEEHAEVTTAIQEGITIDAHPQRKNYLVVAFRSGDPEVAYSTLNTMVNLVVEHQALATRAEELAEYEFYSKQVNIYESRLTQSEASIKEFKLRHQDLDEEAAQERIANLNQAISDFQLKIDETETTVETIKSQLKNESKYLGVQGELYELKNRKYELQQELSTLRRSLQESHPDMVMIKEELGAIDQQVKSITDEYGSHVSTIAGISSKDSNPEELYDELRKNLAESERDLKTQKRTLSTLNNKLEEEYKNLSYVASTQVELAELLRDYDVTKDTHAELLARKENAEIAVASTGSGQGLTYRVVDEPYYPIKPSGLTFLHFLIVAPILAIGAPIGMLLALIMLDPRIRTPNTLMQNDDDDLPLIAVVPHYHSAFSQRLLKKDMLLLSGAFAFGALLYIYIAYIGLSAS